MINGFAVDKKMSLASAVGNNSTINLNRFVFSIPRIMVSNMKDLMIIVLAMCFALAENASRIQNAAVLIMLFKKVI